MPDLLGHVAPPTSPEITPPLFGAYPLLPDTLRVPVRSFEYEPTLTHRVLMPESYCDVVYRFEKIEEGDAVYRFVGPTSY